MQDKVNSTFLHKANRLIEAGFKLIPKKGKEPFRLGKAGSVNLLKQRPINSLNSAFYFEDAETEGTGVAIFTGDHVLCIDFEPHFIRSGHYKELENDLKYNYPDIFQKLVIEGTKNEGIHWYFKCVKTVGKVTLARREPTPEELTSGGRVILLIEALGEDQNVNIYPSPGYTQIKGDLLFLEYLEPEELDFCFALCRQYNEMIEPDLPGINKKEYDNPKAVWNVFNEKIREQHGYQWFIDTLTEAGWETLPETATKIPVKRPGHTTAKSSGGILKEKGFLYLFTTSSEFPAEKCLSPFDVVRHLKYGGDFGQCARALSEQGYGEFNQPYVIEISFFDVSIKKKAVTVQLNRVRFIDFLQGEGIRLFAIDKTYIYIRLSGWLFEEITTEQMKKIVQAHINTLPETHDCGVTRTELMELFYKGIDNYFSRNFLELLSRFTPDFLRDEPQAAYVPFKNGIACVTTEKIELRSYDDVKKHLWKNQVINHSIEIDTFNQAQGVWYKFLSCVCGNPDPAKLSLEQADNFFYLLCLTGYLLHRYKDQTRPFAVILAEATETDERGGGTGKGLFCKGLERVVSVCPIPGKTFDPTNRFAWQTVRLSDSLIIIDDVQKKFLFEALYNAITEGLPIEQKGQQTVYLPYEIAPKIIIISNYVITSEGNHAARRQKLFEFSPFFSPKYNPEHHFKHILFKDWDSAEWNLFYNVQLTCIMMYLKNGLRENEKSDTLKRREARQRYGKEFESWFFDYYLQNGCEEWQGATEIYEQFLKYSEIEKSDYSRNRLKSGLVSVVCTQGHTLDVRRNKQHGNRVEYRVVKGK